MYPIYTMKLIIPFCLIIVLFFSACEVPQYVTVPVDYTAKYQFRKDTSTILIINQAEIGKGRSNRKDINVIKGAAYYAAQYAGTYLKQLPHVNTINIVDSVSLNITTDSIKFLAAKYHADYVLSMTNFFADIGLDQIANSTSYYNTIVNLKFKLYESNGIYYKKLDGSANDPQSEGLYTGLIGSMLIHPRVRANKQSVHTSVEHAVQNAFIYYFPYTVSHTRPLFNDGFLQPAVKEILAGNFEKADSLLQPLLQDKNPQNASKAAYNLAVVYESENDVDAALDMATQSSDKFRNDFASAMLADLKEE